MGKMTPQRWVSLITIVLLLVVIYTTREEIIQAWYLLWQVDLWKLALIIPLQVISYFAAAEMIFSYLRKKGKINAGPWERTKMALELNFVNHILPSGGVSGASYMAWRLGKIGVRYGRATLAQVVRLAMTFVAFLVLMLIAVLMITFDGEISRLTLLVSSGLASLIVFSLLVAIYFIGNEKRLRSASKYVSRGINKLGHKVFRRKKPVLTEIRVTEFFTELHEDFSVIAKDWRLLKGPLFWGIIFTIAEVAMFWVAFWALGTVINPAPLLIAYGLGVIAGAFFITPGGAGGFEVLMIAFLSTAGISNSVVVAGVLLARTILILVTIVTGYIFYQNALSKYGKRPTKR